MNTSATAIGRPAGLGSGNSRNDTTAKTVLTDVGPVRVEGPWDRNGESPPQNAPHNARRLSGYGEQVLTVYCGAWALQGAATACMGLVLDLPTLLRLALLTGIVTPAISITLRAHLGAFAPTQRLRLMSVDQTIIRAGGTAGMLVLPLLVDASPQRVFVAGGDMIRATALGAWLAASRLRRRDTALPMRSTAGR